MKRMPEAIVSKVDHEFGSQYEMAKLTMEILIPGEYNKANISKAINNKLDEIFPAKKEDGINVSMNKLINKYKIEEEKPVYATMTSLALGRW